jgi:hypothetical protein
MLRQGEELPLPAGEELPKATAAGVVPGEVSGALLPACLLPYLLVPCACACSVPSAAAGPTRCACGLTHLTPALLSPALPRSLLPLCFSAPPLQRRAHSPVAMETMPSDITGEEVCGVDRVRCGGVLFGGVACGAERLALPACMLCFGGPPASLAAERAALHRDAAALLPACPQAAVLRADAPFVVLPQLWWSRAALWRPAWRHCRRGPRLQRRGAEAAAAGSCCVCSRSSTLLWNAWRRGCCTPLLPAHPAACCVLPAAAAPAGGPWRRRGG